MGITGTGGMVSLLGIGTGIGTGRGIAHGRGLVLSMETPPLAGGTAPVDAPTEEAALVAPRGCEMRIDMVAAEDEVLAEGAPIARLRDAPDVTLVAPMPARVARIRLLPGRRLGEIVLFREAGGERSRHDTAGAASSADALAALAQRAGFWPRLRRRPYGGLPGPAERPAAIVVMARDTRPFAPDPRHEVTGREEALVRGLAALGLLTDGPIFLCEDGARPLLPRGDGGPRVTRVAVGPRHPQGLAGICLHDLCPATDARPVWDLHVGDVADLGELLGTGVLPQTRVVSVAGPALTETRLLRCQIGADTRGLSYGAVRPGPHAILAGSPLDGRAAHWLGPRDRQVSVLPEPPGETRPHWFLSALTRSSRPKPLIPTAALSQAAGGAFPVMAMLRALSTGDDETATRLGALSLVEEDLALVDYVVGGAPSASDLLRGFLDRAQAEAAP
ncbi:Na(+)-translocating NADH-quinone reductase subunit A [Roseibacterium sp. SDUM158017]|uniref:Na(+)-translocating NADH-quinone reductase subunit A n=1 Tax=Roseicyclus salinarum TaxID=3036773 RepID=UPI0024152252|nr:Na(+)-translocating NADH-quinone reductase subunit A [Roseibacterium sp. SDUM158017]MDG4647329.1 Na(+)-translocating NADH-quinone reductase subunit A [Roseibacterium sp. SDUM158017]